MSDVQNEAPIVTWTCGVTEDELRTLLRGADCFIMRAMLHEEHKRMAWGRTYREDAATLKRLHAKLTGTYNAASPSTEQPNP